MYKLKKISHLLQFKEKNYFKPMCCIIISNKLQENTEFYTMLKTTLISLQNDKNYISIYLINSDDFQDENNTYNELNKENPYFLMFFRSIQYEFFNNPVNDFIPNIVSKICSINDGYLANISKAFLPKDKQQTTETKEIVVEDKNSKSNIKEDIKPTNKKEEKKKKKEITTESVQESIEESSSEGSNDEVINEKKRLLKEKQKLLQEINEE